jgi:putative Mg2+ transporter-C (MgtC) family protein
MPEAMQWQLLLRVSLAVVIGAVIGIEREVTGKDAGLRTIILVAVGSCLFTCGGFFLIHGQQTDPTRIAAQVVTGIGFLGAGAIFRGDSHVRGLTTAATIWLVAALGMAAGFGLYILAVGATAISLVVLVLLRPVEKRLLSGRSANRTP